MNKTRFKHNKKRNSAFLFEALIKEMAKCVLRKDANRQTHVAQVIKEHFAKGTCLYGDLQAYRAINETKDVSSDLARRIVEEAKNQSKQIDRRKLFTEQSAIIKKINHSLGSEVYTNFVPDYKNLANISQLFSDTSGSIKKKVLLEESLIKSMSASHNLEQSEEAEMQPIDAIVYKTFVNRFNEEYSSKLQDEQRELLSRYVFSMSDNGVSLKSFLNEEVDRLRGVVRASYDLKEIKEDKKMTEKAKRVEEFLDSLHTAPINEEQVKKILKIQELAYEVTENG